MKKLLAFLMALCLMMTAFAAVAEEGPRVLQDENPPALVPVNGAYARIVDANGNVLAEITAEGQLKMTDVHHRSTEPLMDVSSRLNLAYEKLMTGVHFSDVAHAHAHEILKDEINQRLAGTNLTAYDVAMFELFDVKLLDDAASLLTEGAMIEFTIKPELADGKVLLVSFSANGGEWHLINHFTGNSDGSMTLRIPSDGTVALMQEHKVINAPGSSYIENNIEDITNTNTSETSNFTPSVSGKPLPPIVTTVDEHGQTVIATIRHKDGRLIKPIYANDALIITPASESAYVMDITTHEHLQWSYDGILEAETIGHIRTGIGIEIDDMLKADGFGHLDHTQMVVRDLFEVTAYGDLVEAFYNEDHELEIKFDLQHPADKPLIVIFSSDSTNWHVMSHENVIVDESGVLTLQLPDAGTVAFMTEKGDLLTNVTYHSPQ